MFNKISTLFNRICNDKDKLNPYLLLGVYEIPFYDDAMNEQHTYVEYTALCKRLPEHKYDIESGKLTIILAQRSQINDSGIQWNEVRLLRTEINPKKK